MQPFRRHHPSGDVVYDMERNMSAVEDSLRSLESARQISRAVMLDAVTLTGSTENLVDHGLGRVVEGWRLVDVQADARIWRVASPTVAGYDATRHLVLNCSGNVTIRLEVF